MGRAFWAPGRRAVRRSRSFTRSSLPTAHLLYLRLLNRRRSACLKTTGQIQNPQDFFEAGIAEVPTRN